jgi:hypothetical protein
MLNGRREGKRTSLFTKGNTDDIDLRLRLFDPLAFRRGKEPQRFAAVNNHAAEKPNSSGALGIEIERRNDA